MIWFSSFFSPAIILVALFTIFYAWRLWGNGKFKRRGIAHTEPSIFFGHANDLMLKRISFIDYIKKLYWDLPNEAVSGVFQLTMPLLMIRDVELIKQITVKKFDCFANHSSSDMPNFDKILGKSLTGLADEKWRVTRNMLSPAFTGSKMKIMFKLMNDCAVNTVEAISCKLEDGKVTLEIKDLFNRYCNDTIATTIFGVEVNSVTETDNEFFSMGKKLTTFNLLSQIKGFLAFMAPKIFTALNLNMLDTQASDYFVNLVKDTIKYRIENKIVRPDMINMYIDSQREEINQNNEKVIDNEYVVKSSNDEAISKKWDLDEFVAQCILFFFAGFETAANSFMFLAYELAINPDVQDKLLEEIDEARKSLGDKPLTSEHLQGMKYFECVIQESLRKWPVAIANDRKCTKDCTLYDSKGKSHHFKVGDYINLPTIAIQNDSRYFEDADKFWPERWNAENKDKINPYAMLSFGIGPRMCIGNRYAIMEAKCVFYNLLRKFRIERCEKTQVPFKMEKGISTSLAGKGMWLRLKVRN